MCTKHGLEDYKLPDPTFGDGMMGIDMNLSQGKWLVKQKTKIANQFTVY